MQLRAHLPDSIVGWSKFLGAACLGGAVVLESLTVGVGQLPANLLASSTVGISLSQGTLQATNLLPGVATNTIDFTASNTGTVTEDLDLKITGVTDTLATIGDLGQLEFLVNGTTYSLDPSAHNLLGLTAPLTLGSLESLTIPIANLVPAGGRVTIPLAVELANGEGFGNAWNGQQATIDYEIVATQSATPTTTPSHTTPTTTPSTTVISPRIPTTSVSPQSVLPAHRVVTNTKTAKPTPVKLVTGPPVAPNGSDPLTDLGIAGVVAGVLGLLGSQRRRRHGVANDGPSDR
jgi:hypothetical protein